jgi:hypothetical protein
MAKALHSLCSTFNIGRLLESKEIKGARNAARMFKMKNGTFWSEILKGRNYV